MAKEKLSNEEVFQKLFEGTGKPVEELRADYEEIVKEVTADPKFSNATPENLEAIARNKLVIRVRREANSPAITWQGTVLGVGDLVDTVRRQREFSEAAYKKDPVAAERGVMYQGRLVMATSGKDETTGEDIIIPLYPKTESNIKWGRAGKPIQEHSWLRNVYGVALPIDKKTKQPGEPRVFSMTISGTLAQTPNIPLNKKVKFKAIDKTKPEHVAIGEYNISDSKFTKFELAPEINMPEVETVISTLCASRYETLGDLEEYHLVHSEDWSRWVITEGNVSYLNLEPNVKTQNLRMILDDESMLFASPDPMSSTGVTCWIPTDRGIEIDFAQDSRVYVIGRTSQGKKMDPITREVTDEPGDVMINIFGIYCPEMFKVSKDVEEVPEDALEPTESDW